MMIQGPHRSLVALAAGAVVVFLLVAQGCVGDAPTVAPSDGGPADSSLADSAVTDSASSDVATQDAAPDTGTPDTGTDADAGTTTVYSDMTDAASWSTFDTTTNVSAAAKGFAGAAFDGRYLYFAPRANGSPGVVARYDTQAAFNVAGSWSTFDVATVTGSAKFSGATFDGRYIYFVPNLNGAVARYDTQGTFTTSGSWSTFDVSSVAASAKSFVGATFDGRYVYFAGNNNGTVAVGLVARLDTQGTFTAPGSWSTFDVTAVNASAKGLVGAVFDGRYVYLVPGPPNGNVVRYDTQATFTAVGSWSAFDVTTVNAAAKGFYGAAFDGRYLYLAPNSNDTAWIGIVARYDTQATFGSAGSWSTFDLTAVNANAHGFESAAFDGRYVYFVPLAGYPYGSPLGVIARYDTQAAFNTAGSWSTFDVGSVNSGAKGFLGAAFDGRYLYLVPLSNTNGLATGVAARFDAKQPSSMPKLCASAAALHCFSGSFF